MKKRKQLKQRFYPKDIKIYAIYPNILNILDSKKYKIDIFFYEKLKMLIYQSIRYET